MLRVLTIGDDGSYWILRRVGTHFLSLAASHHVAGFHLWAAFGEAGSPCKIMDSEKIPMPTSGIKTPGVINLQASARNVLTAILLDSSPEGCPQFVSFGTTPRRGVACNNQMIEILFLLSSNSDLIICICVCL